MEAYIGIVGLTAGILIGWVMRAFLDEKRSKSGCYMCGRHDRNGLIRWHIRSRSMNICSKCHPFYKQRFMDEADSDTHNFDTHAV